jgi:hypothetical protein
MHTFNPCNPATSTSTSTSTAAKPLAANNLFVPFVPISVNVNLVAAQPLAKHLAALAPELAHLSLDNFAAMQFKKSELHQKVAECATSYEALLDTYRLNMQDLYSCLSAYLLALGLAAEFPDNENLQANLQISLQQVHAYAAAMDLSAAEYGVDSSIQPELLFAACLKRLQLLQERWKDNHTQSIELALQQQTDAVYGAVATCLTDICQHGLDNQISLEPTPQAQEDVLVALATFVDLPFSGDWPELMQQDIALGNEGGLQ